MIFFKTERLLVRNWHADDVETLHALYNDRAVMRFFPRHVPLDECRTRVERWGRQGTIDGHTFAPLMLRDQPDAGMIGFCGLFAIVQDGLPRIGEHEIGWTIAPPHWRRGYAREAATGWLSQAFGRLGLERINAFTAQINEPSRAVMRSIGMRRVENGDFDHPNVDDGPLRRHVLYEITRS